MKKIEAIIRKTKFEDVKEVVLLLRRVDKRIEEEGLDIYEHGENCYN